MPSMIVHTTITKKNTMRSQTTTTTTTTTTYSNNNSINNDYKGHINKRLLWTNYCYSYETIIIVMTVVVNLFSVVFLWHKS